jgi:S-formylglutathione hydrolase FrmB
MFGRRKAGRGIAAAAFCLAAAVPLAAQTARHGRVVTDSLWSYALGTWKKALVYLPPSYDHSTRRYPVAYYLHGLSGNETNWVKAGHLDATADSLIARGMAELVIVMPDGDDSWWMTASLLPDFAGCVRRLPAYAGRADSYCVPWPHYDDYVAYDVLRFIDGKYRTLADRAHRGLAGLSMGGYGAIALALQYPKLFAAAASHSGVVWPLEWAPDGVTARPAGTPDSTWRRIRLGEIGKSMWATFGRDTIAWYSHDPVHLLARARARHDPLPAMKADCGTGDPFLAGNRAFRDALAARGVRLEYAEYPGAHDWRYWSTHAAESLRWLSERLR